MPSYLTARCANPKTRVPGEANARTHARTTVVTGETLIEAPGQEAEAGRRGDARTLQRRAGHEVAVSAAVREQPGHALGPRHALGRCRKGLAAAAAGVASGHRGANAEAR